MQKLTVQDILNATGGTLLSGDPQAEITSVVTNSGAAGEGSLFVPIIGDKFDAHEFIKAAFDMGAAATLTQKETELLVDKTIIHVDDTRRAFGDIAAYYKAKYRIPTVAVTGSVGKTTTKDMLAAALGRKYNTLKTPNNFNNDIGVPTTVLMQEKEHGAAVIEVGMNHFGEIKRLVGIVRPDAAVITNIGMSHIENLGSREGILKAKMEVTSYFDKDSTLIINGDDEYLSAIKGSGEYKIIRYGITGSANDVTAKDIVNKGLDGIEFTVTANGKDYRAAVKLPGRHNVYNALAAVCAGIVFGVSPEESIKGIENCEYTSQRLELEHHKGIEIINDCYNASPDSVKAALSIMPYSLQKRRVAILGDMQEMGEYAAEAHRRLGREIVKNGIDLLITAGGSAGMIAEGASELGFTNYKCFDKTLEAANCAKELVKDGDCVLVKASHGMRFEEIVAAIKEI